MTDMDKMARELLKDSERGKPGDFMPFADVVAERDALKAIATAMLTAPPGWKLVPVEPTEEMVDAASEAHMPFGDMHFAITSAILAAPEPK